MDYSDGKEIERMIEPILNNQQEIAKVLAVILERLPEVKKESK